jgi:hypothetical protein
VLVACSGYRTTQACNDTVLIMKVSAAMRAGHVVARCSYAFSALHTDDDSVLILLVLMLSLLYCTVNQTQM